MDRRFSKSWTVRLWSFPHPGVLEKQSASLATRVFHLYEDLTVIVSTPSRQDLHLSGLPSLCRGPNRRVKKDIHDS